MRPHIYIYEAPSLSRSGGGEVEERAILDSATAVSRGDANAREIR